MLTELFTLGVEDDVADNSEDDHSGLALTAAATVEATRAGNSSGQDENAPDQAAARSSGTHLLETIRVWIRVSVLERRVQVSAFSAIKQTAFRTICMQPTLFNNGSSIDAIIMYIRSDSSTYLRPLATPT